MTTGTFTYNALRPKTLKERIKTLKLGKSNSFSIGTTALKPYISIWPVGLVWFARYWVKCRTAILSLFYGGLCGGFS